MAEARIDFADLDRIAVTRGPGSFTGLRLGLAAARGLGLAANKPVLGIDRLSIYRSQNADISLAVPLIIALESKRAELFCQVCRPGLTPDDPVLLTPEEINGLALTLAPVRIAGDASALLAPLFSPDVFLPEPKAEVVIAAELAAAAPPDDPALLPRPLYLRAPDVTCAKAS